MKNYQSYALLKKPTWAPPSWLFGPVWTFLYCLIFVSFGAALYKFVGRDIPALVALPFALNLVFNFSFTYFEFVLKNNYLALADVLLVLATLLWATLAVFPFAPWIAYFQIPYILWVAFASVLQMTVTYLNK